MHRHTFFVLLSFAASGCVGKGTYDAKVAELNACHDDSQQKQHLVDQMTQAGAALNSQLSDAKGRRSLPGGELIYRRWVPSRRPWPTKRGASRRTWQNSRASWLSCNDRKRRSVNGRRLSEAYSRASRG